MQDRLLWRKSKIRFVEKVYPSYELPDFMKGVSSIFTDDFICHQPRRWYEIFKVLRVAYENKTGEKLPSNTVGIREAGGPPTPLILNGWVFTEDNEKRKRWIETVDWAKKHDLLQLLVVEDKDKKS